MKRDMDLIRELLLQIEDAPNKPSWKDLTPVGDEKETKRRLDHLRLAYDAGYFKAITRNAIGGFWLPQDMELTWQGHDFIDSIRDPEIWSKTKTGALAAGGFTMDLLKDLAKGYVKTKIEETTGVKL